ncbi:MAG: hypothetical protein IMY87_03855 [Chloroflexi bacterium]|nr:hypothetical protein [Chloroflexota bacterium]
MAEKKEEKTCFVIAPIGDEGTHIRKRSEQLLKYVIKPTMKECGYLAIRADDIEKPGIITSQIIQHVMDDDLVVADLTDQNPNVFYELAIRHFVKKPVVQFIESGQHIPFDVYTTRTIHVNHLDWDSVAEFKKELVKHTRSVEVDPTAVDNPISVAVNLGPLLKSEKPLERSIAEIMHTLQTIRYDIAERAISSPYSESSRRAISEMFIALYDIAYILAIEEGEELTREQLERALDHLEYIVNRLRVLALESGIPPEARLWQDVMARLRRYRH